MFHLRLERAWNKKLSQSKNYVYKTTMYSVQSLLHTNKEIAEETGITNNCKILGKIGKA